MASVMTTNVDGQKLYLAETRDDYESSWWTPDRDLADTDWGLGDEEVELDCINALKRYKHFYSDPNTPLDKTYFELGDLVLEPITSN